MVERILWQQMFTRKVRQPLALTEPLGPLFSQKSATEPNPEPTESTLHHHTLFLQVLHILSRSLGLFWIRSVGGLLWTLGFRKMRHISQLPVSTTFVKIILGRVVGEFPLSDKILRFSEAFRYVTILLRILVSDGARGSVVGSGIMLEAGRVRAHKWWNFFNLPNASCRTMTPGLRTVTYLHISRKCLQCLDDPKYFCLFLI